VKPTLQALLVADRVYRDAATGKFIIAGTFNRLCYSKTPPVTPPSGQTPGKVMGGMDAGSPYAYVSLTEVRGKVPLVFRYVDLTDNNPLLVSEFEVQANSPLETVELVLPLPRLPIPHAGVFAFEIASGNEPLGSVRLVVEEMKPPASAGPPTQIEAG
jgi:hypothetical protein